jgi:hypothetical protein
MKMLAEKYHAAAAVAVVLLLVIMVVSGILFTWSMIEAKQSEIEARRIELEVLKRRASQPPAAVSGQTRSVDPFLGNGPFALAANTLQQRVVGLIEQAGGTLVTVGIDPPITADDESGRRVVVQAVAELSNDALQQVLYHLEAEAPFVFVENLLVSRLVPRGSGDAEEAATSPRLSVDLRAAGYFRRSTP